jgi:hypothetical protein
VQISQNLEIDFFSAITLLSHSTICMRSQDSAVGIATGYGLDD